MSLRPIAPHTPVKLIRADEFSGGPGYATWRPKGSGDWLLIYTLAGSGRVATATGAIRVKAGSGVLFRAGDPQDYCTWPGADSWVIRWAHFQPRPHWAAWLCWPEPLKGVLHFQLRDSATREQVATALLEAIRTHRQADLLGADFAANALERAFLLIHSQQGPVLDARVRLALDHMATHLDAPLALADLAAVARLSISRFAHLFRQQTGFAPSAYVERMRLQRAADLLRSSDLAIKEIAAACGYDDPFYFTNRFRRLYRTSPSAYRARPSGRRGVRGQGGRTASTA